MGDWVFSRGIDKGGRIEREADARLVPSENLKADETRI